MYNDPLAIEIKEWIDGCLSKLSSNELQKILADANPPLTSRDKRHSMAAFWDMAVSHEEKLSINMLHSLDRGSDEYRRAA
jgi:hypothetical protein